MEQSKSKRAGCCNFRSHLKLWMMFVSILQLRDGVLKVTTEVLPKLSDKCLVEVWRNSKRCKAITSHTEELSKGDGRVQEMCPVKGQGY